MDQGLAVVIGMSVAYIASFAGMLFAYLSYRKRKKGSEHEDD
jgi:H+/gluconate symporter-like permease